MRNLALAAALLGSTAILRMMPDASDAGGGAPVPEFLSTVDALNSLDPDDDANWTADGLPDVDVMEALTGNKWLSRGDLEGFPIDRASARAAKEAAVPLIPPVPEPVLDPVPVDQAPPPDAPTDDPAPVDPPADETPPPPPADDPAPVQPPALLQTATPGRIVLLIMPDHHAYAGSVGLVVKALDDGSLNVHAFAPDGGAPGFFTGVFSKADVDAMPDGPEKNAALSCVWDWPPRLTA